LRSDQVVSKLTPYPTRRADRTASFRDSAFFPRNEKKGVLPKKRTGLDTDRIDYYLLHALNGAVWDTLEGLCVIDFLHQAIEDGRIVNAGFSFHGLAEDFMRIVDAYPWEFCQIQYNFLDQKNQAGTAGLKNAAAKSLGVIVMEPLRGGNPGLATPPPAVAEIWNEAKTRRTPAEWALRWVLRWNDRRVKSAVDDLK
jgi:uncharacterized protein